MYYLFHSPLRFQVLPQCLNTPISHHLPPISEPMLGLIIWQQSAEALYLEQEAKSVYLLQLSLLKAT